MIVCHIVHKSRLVCQSCMFHVETILNAPPDRHASHANLAVTRSNVSSDQMEAKILRHVASTVEQAHGHPDLWKTQVRSNRAGMCGEAGLYGRRSGNGEDRTSRTSG